MKNWWRRSERESGNGVIEDSDGGEEEVCSGGSSLVPRPET